MDNKRRIVIYHSYSGHTKMIANIIKKKLDCDVLELEPKYEFSSDYDEVVKEYQNNEKDKSTVEIKDININLDNYDEIIIGSPVWWYRPCPAIRAFLTKYDLSNKTIIPFATNAGWLGRTFVEIKKLCPNSNVINEKNIVFESYSSNLVTSTDEINDWINKLQKISILKQIIINLSFIVL